MDLNTTFKIADWIRNLPLLHNSSTVDTSPNSPIWKLCENISNYLYTNKYTCDIIRDMDKAMFEFIVNKVMTSDLIINDSETNVEWLWTCITDDRIKPEIFVERKENDTTLNIIHNDSYSWINNTYDRYLLSVKIQKQEEKEFVAFYNNEELEEDKYIYSKISENEEQSPNDNGSECRNLSPSLNNYGYGGSYFCICTIL